MAALTAWAGPRSSCFTDKLAAHKVQYRHGARKWGGDMAGISDELARLAELHATGALTEHEFAQAKARLLRPTEAATSRPAAAPSPGPTMKGVLRRLLMRVAPLLLVAAVGTTITAIVQGMDDGVARFTLTYESTGNFLVNAEVHCGSAFVKGTPETVEVGPGIQMSGAHDIDEPKTDSELCKIHQDAQWARVRMWGAVSLVLFGLVALRAWWGYQEAEVRKAHRRAAGRRPSP